MPKDYEVPEPFSFRFFVVFVEEVAIRRSLLQQVLEHSEISPKGELNASDEVPLDLHLLLVLVLPVFSLYRLFLPT